MRGTTASITVLMGVAALVVLGSPATSLGQGAPSVIVDRESVTVGDEVHVRGSGWGPGLVSIELCGNEALDATADCNVRGSTQFAVRDAGEFFGLIRAALPPKPCPCVVRVSSHASGVVVTEPVSFPEAGFEAPQSRVPDPDVRRTLKISEMAISGRDTWGAWFGVGTERNLAVTIVNNGSTPVRDPALSVTMGKAEDPTGVIAVPPVGRLGPGDRATINVPLELDVLSYGRYTVRAELSGPGGAVVSRARVETYPWGLLALVLMVFQLLLLAVRNRVRARVLRRERFNSELSNFGDAVPALGTAQEMQDAPEQLEADPLPLNGPHHIVHALDAPRPQVIDLTAAGINGNRHSTAVEGSALEMHAGSEISLSDDIGILRQDARRAISRAADLSEALIAASVARAQALEKRAAEHQRAAEERYAEACRLLEIARARADELAVAADAVARLAQREATADREAAQRQLLDAEAERQALLEAGRTAVDSVVADLEQRANELTAKLESDIPSQVRDELDRRLSSALSRALTETPGFERLRSR